jgi:radial spoke head protein 4A
MRSLKGLATSTGANNIRLWGKILGSDKDYYIAEGSFEGGVDESEKPGDFEPRGTGVNKFAYWATSSTLTSWTLLPDLFPKDIKAARETKVLLTGDLNRQIITNPFFFGKELNYLRAQIARITQSTTLVPKGYYKMVEDSTVDVEENIPEEGPIPIPSTLNMAKAENWVHHAESILGCNRLRHLETEAPEGVDPDVWVAQIKKADPAEPRLKSIVADKKVKGGLPCWSVRLCGDSTQFGS